MKKLENIYLIGPMGSGKTSVGHQLAKLTKMPFFDSDAEIERKTGASISWIFEIEQESGFRERETQIIDFLTQKNQIILSTGGGSILRKENRERLSQNGVVVYLRVSLAEQLKRATHRPGLRPLLNVSQPEIKLAQLSQEREPLYMAIADLIYETDRQTPKEIAGQILNDIKRLPINSQNSTNSR